jgi:CPA2 family monovalent cation:H+ antiporter-2
VGQAPTLIAAGTGEYAWLFLEVGLVLLALALLARLARRTGFSPIPLYLIAGLVLGVVRPAQISTETIVLESQIAVMLLLFMLGLEYTGVEISASLRAGVGAGLADVLLNFTPGAVLALALGWTPLQAVLLGGVTYVSSSSITAKALDDLGRLGNRETPAILSILVFEDLMMAPYLPLVAVLLAGGSVAAGLISVGVAVAAVAAALWVAIYHGQRLSRGILHSSDEVVLLTMVGLLLVFSGGAEILRVSGAVVAFLLGLAISGALADRARQLFGPLRDLFAAFFFVLFGLQIDISSIPEVALMAAILFVVTALTKFAAGWIATRKTIAVPGRIRAGTALIARGEFSIVIAGLGVAAGSQSPLAALAATYVLISAVAGPLLMRYSVDVTKLTLFVTRRHR